MKHFVSAAALACILTACSGEPAADNQGAAVPEAKSQAGEASQDTNESFDDMAGPANAELRRIPGPFRGIWATEARYCGIANHNRFNVSGEGVRFFEDGGNATDIRGSDDVLAVTWRQRDPDDVTRTRAVYFALEDDGAMRVRLGDNESITYRRCPAESDTAGSGTGQAAIVPARFRGLYALDRRACDEDYTYNPAFQNVTVRANEVGFFETGGPVTDVNVDGNDIAITLNEKVGDTVSSRAIYIALTGEETARYRAGEGSPREMVRCG